LLRPGGLDRATLESTLGSPLAAPDARSPRASGTLASHYAPSAKLRLFPVATLAQAWRDQPAGARPTVAVYSRQALPPLAGVPWAAVRRMPEDARATAHELFAVLRELDAQGVDQIWVEEPPAGPAWDAVNDRLRRAAAA
jgi:L-threonylcarbamoyladenylate synthase